MNTLVFCSIMGMVYAAITTIASIVLGGIGLWLLGVEGSLTNGFFSMVVANMVINILVGAGLAYIVDDTRSIN